MSKYGRLLTFALSLILAPSLLMAQTYGTEQIAVTTFDTPSAAMSASTSQAFPLGMIPVSLSLNYGSPFRLTSYTAIQQLSNYDSASCSMTTGNGGDPALWDTSVGCHVGQNAWSVTTRATLAEVMTFFNSLTAREQKTFAYFRAPGALSGESYRYVINWQPEFTYCITGPF